MTVLDKCCCCVPLRTGGVVLGVLSLILSVILSVIFGITLVTTFTNAQEYQQLINHTIDQNPDFPADADIGVVLTVMQVMAGIFLGLMLVNCICASLLIYGAVKGRSGFVLPYLIVSGISTTGQMLTVISDVFKLISSDVDEVEQLWTSLVNDVVIFAINGYLWLCVYSLYKKYKNAKLPQTVESSLSYPSAKVNYSNLK